MVPLLTLCFALLAVTLAEPQDPYAVRATCGQTGRTCVLEGAHCFQNNKCVCKRNNPLGAGNFQCYKTDTAFCEIKNDPSLRTFAGENEHFPFMCRYIASETRTYIRSRNGRLIGFCLATIYGVNGKHKGKTFVHGFDMAFMLAYSNKHHLFNLKHRAISNDNRNTVEYLANKGKYSPFFVNRTEDISYNDRRRGISVTFDWDRRNNQFIFEAPACGMRVTHVPYDTAFGIEQRQVPGLAIAFSKYHNPSWPSDNRGVCLNKGATFADIEVNDIGVQRSLLLREYKYHIPQEVQQCIGIRNTLNNCEFAMQKSAMARCDWIFKRPHFMKCFDKTTTTAVETLTLFDSCVNAWCNDTPCTTAIDLIKLKGCDKLNNVPELEQFMLGNMCPPPRSV